MRLKEIRTFYYHDYYHVMNQVYIKIVNLVSKHTEDQIYHQVENQLESQIITTVWVNIKSVMKNDETKRY